MNQGLIVTLMAFTLALVCCRTRNDAYLFKDQNSSASLPKTASIDELLSKTYEESAVLALGHTNHTYSKVWLTLKAVLDKYGLDPRLKYVALESGSDSDFLQQELSLSPLSEVTTKHRGKHWFRHWKSMVCSNQEPAFTAKFLSRKIRRLNQDRKKIGLKPILLRAIDGAKDLEGYAEESRAMIGDCEIPQSELKHASITNSHNREEDTLRHFREKILANLKRQDKAILVYHYAHLVNGFSACLFKDVNGTWKTHKGTSNWLGLFYNTAGLPHKKIVSSVIVDWPSYPYSDSNGEFKLTDKLAKKIEAPFAVDLTQAHAYMAMRGLENFNESAYLKMDLKGAPQNMESRAQLSEMVDALIWYPLPEDRKNMFHSEGAIYLWDELCKEDEKSRISAEIFKQMEEWSAAIESRYEDY